MSRGRKKKIWMKQSLDSVAGGPGINQPVWWNLSLQHWFLDINAMDLRQARADSSKSEGFLAIGLNLAISNHCMMMALIRIIIGDEECYEPFPPFNLSLPPPLQVLSKGTSLATQFNFKPNRPNEKRQIWHIFNWICISDELGIAVTLFFLN